jgi:hypothetical protein
MDDSKRIANEKFLFGMMRVSRYWVWKDELEVYRLHNDKIIPETMRGYESILRIVRPQFAYLFITPPTLSTPTTSSP